MKMDKKKRSSGYSFFIALVVSLGGFLFGFDASVISGVIGFVSPQFNLNVIQQGWVVSSPSFAAMFAMLLSGTISDIIGRKKVLIYAAVLYAVSAVLSALAPNYQWLVTARMIGGIAFGAVLILAPLYIGEIAPSEKRGRLVSIQQLNIVLGFSASYFSNYFLLGLMDAAASPLDEFNVWRWMLGVESLPAILYLILLFFVPKSPRWLLNRGKEQEAQQVLNTIFGEERAQKEKEKIKQKLRDQNEKTSLSTLFKPGMKIVMLLGITIGVVQQITGVNAIFFYATTIFEQSGVGKNAAFSQAIFVGIINVVFTLLAMAFIDRLGRRPLMLTGLAGVILSMAITSYGFYKATYTLTEENVQGISQALDRTKLRPFYHITYDNDVDFKNALKEALGENVFGKYESEIIQAAAKINPVVILIGILAFVASFAFSLGPVMWVLFSEIFPGRNRGLAIAFFGFINSCTSTFVQFIFPWELANLGNAGAYLIFGLFGVIGLLLLAKFLPETKGKSLEDIETLLVK
ncbi:sugar porter family MFS transporter [Fulvivirgaceae bacterium BMA12]|uniref:Sugar porter family MFS transporter n=1 Tax=Agaribacillus aureus TaxID=3051825 RepID=A0ABT8LJB2_9BACT|nr:sugar porter family MFS transporter [Fulvivirgaceae bacterium BMA12]